jgi:ankyrin repeat protein
MASVPNLTAQVSAFGRAALAVVDGDAATLRVLLQADPKLVTDAGLPFNAPQTQQHASPLLHYVAANGVEDALQRTPSNAPEILRILLDAGALPDQLGGAYGGGPNQTCLCLLVSSYHPMAAGVQSDLVRILVRGGAKPNGLQDDGAPLATALTFGYTAAARTLVECGARVDNVFFAAGLGDVAATRAFFDDDGTPKLGSSGTYVQCIGQAPAPLESSAVVQEALHFASLHGHIEVGSFLVSECGADVNGLQPTGHHCALPLMQALFTGVRGHMVEWLVRNGANPRLRDPKRKQTALEFVESVGDIVQAELIRRAAEKQPGDGASSL